MEYKAEYIWIDGSEPTPQLRSKTRIINADDLGKLKEPIEADTYIYSDGSQEGSPVSLWGFDGSSTGQALGSESDCVLVPERIYKDPLRNGPSILVMCAVMLPNSEPHSTNTRHRCYGLDFDLLQLGCIFAFEQEYTFVNRYGDPIGLKEGRRGYSEAFENGQKIVTRDILPQGPYYCSAGAGLAIGRGIAEEHLDACLEAGISISGINAEVMPGQWEFQIGPKSAVRASDDLWVARYLLHRIAEKHGVVVSFDPKPTEGDWNGAGCHANFSTLAMRESYDACIEACEKLKDRHELHIKNYGNGIESRLTGAHETCSFKEFKYGVSDRGASIRIPWQVKVDGKGYIEDRRPNSNCDPYVVSSLILEALC